MSIAATCPGCSAQYQLADSMRGKKVRCKSCSEIFLVQSKSVARDDDEDDKRIQTAPRPPKRAVPVEEDEDSPRPKPRRRSGKKRSNGSLLPLLIGGGILAVVLMLLLGGVGVWAYFRSRQPQTTPVASSSDPAGNAAQPVKAPPPPQNQGGPAFPPEQNAPGGNPNPAPVFPPMQPPAQPQMGGQGPLAAQISNANVSGLGAQMEVTVDYRFTSGNPAGHRLFLIIRATRAGGLRQNYYLAELRSIGDRTEGTIGARGMTFGSEHGPFEMWIGETPPGVLSPRSDRELSKISNVETVAFKQPTIPGMRPPIGPRRPRP